MKKSINENIIFLYFVLFARFISTGTAIAQAPGFDYTGYDMLLKKNVSDGLVDYSYLKDNPAPLDDFLKQIETVDREKFSKWSENERKAFWINAYNAITLFAIRENFPIKPGGFLARARFPKNSIRQIAKVWDTVYIKVVGRDLTLNQIEHDILRKEFDDPRIHFAIVCASIGCPPLLAGAFFPESIDEQLDFMGKNFVRNEKYVRLDTSKKKIHLSSIFKWYAEDFKIDVDSSWLNRYKDKYRGIIAYISDIIDEDAAKFLKNNKVKIDFLDYDWSLNEHKH